MRSIFMPALLLLAACGEALERAPLPDVVAQAEPVWFICDAIDAPAILVFADQPDDGAVQVVQFSKQTGAPAFDAAISLGQREGAAGSLYTPLLADGAEIGFVRQLNPDMLETPGLAYTPPVTSVRLRDLEAQCRWMPRTRLLAFTQRRSVLVYEGEDGDLIYTTYDFAAPLAPIELTQNGRTTTFSAEARDGAEALTSEGVSFSFTGREGFGYRVTARRDGAGALEVTRNGAAVQSEPLLVFQLGVASE